MYYDREFRSHEEKCPMLLNKQCPMMYMNKENIYQHSNYNSPSFCSVEDDKQLELYYPEIYFKIYPSIKYHCDMIEHKHGKAYCPARAEIDAIIEEVSIKVEKDLDEDEYDQKKKRQYPRGRLVRDLVGIMLLNELIGRRRVPYYGGYYY